MCDAYLAGLYLCYLFLIFFGVLCPLDLIKKVYFPETGKPLIQDLKSEVSGDFEKTLLILAEVQSNNFFSVLHHI